MRKTIYIAIILFLLISCEKYADDTISQKEYRELADKINFSCESTPIKWYVRGKLNQLEFCMNHGIDDYAMRLNSVSHFVTNTPSLNSSDTSSLSGTLLQLSSTKFMINDNSWTRSRREYFILEFPLYPAGSSFQEMLINEVDNGEKALKEFSLNSENPKNQYRIRFGQRVIRDNGGLGYSHISTDTGDQKDSYLIFQNIKRTTSDLKETLYMEAIFEVNLYKNNGDFWGRLTDGELKLEINYDLVN